MTKKRATKASRRGTIWVPDSDKFTIDGKELSVSELVPGTKLTQTITTTATPRYVNSVRTIEGKVWHVNAPNLLILTLPDNKNQVFNVPSHAKFNIDGKEKTVFDLKIRNEDQSNHRH